MARRMSPFEMLIRMRVDAHPDAPWLHFDGEVTTWAGALDGVRRAANGLVALGVRPGDRVAIMLANRPEFLWVHFATSMIGAASVPINTAQRGAALQHVLSDSGSVVLVCEGPVADAARAAAAEVPSVRTLVVDGAHTSQEWGLDRLLDQSATDPVVTVEDDQGGRASGLAGILYTSGTTGPPKGVVATGDAMGLLEVLAATGVGQGDVLYTALPLFHGNALGVSTLGSMLLDAQLALGRRFSASRHFDECRRYGAVEFNTLGAMIPMLLAQEPRSDDADNPVRVVLSAGCPAWAWEQFQERFGVRLVEWFGMVDSPGFLLNAEGRVGAMGKPVGGVEFQVVGADDGPVPAGTVGELVFRHPGGRQSEYHNAPDLTDESYRGGWFHSGDLAECDADGFFYYRGRKKESMRRRGENISAWEVESAVASHPAVEDCAAHSTPSDLGEDEVKAVVVLREGASVRPEELLDHCQGRLAYYAIPRYVEFVDEIPRTGTQRPNYSALKERGVTSGTWDREAAGYKVERV